MKLVYTATMKVQVLRINSNDRFCRLVLTYLLTYSRVTQKIFVVFFKNNFTAS